MKFIDKSKAPHDIHTWVQTQPKDENGRPINCRYQHMPSEVKAVVKTCLLEEQGYLCCYTGLRIRDNSSHIEHFKPQSLCDDLEDIEYRNLHAAFPHQDQERANFGAQKKDYWYDPHLLVSPLDTSCEQRFRFRLSGKIEPVSANDEPARTTIEKLGLDDAELTRMRRSAIRAELGLDGTKGKQVSNNKLLRISRNLCERNTHTNEFREFCFAIQQAAEELHTNRQKTQVKRTYSENKKKKRK